MTREGFGVDWGGVDRHINSTDVLFTFTFSLRFSELNVLQTHPEPCPITNALSSGLVLDFLSLLPLQAHRNNLQASDTGETHHASGLPPVSTTFSQSTADARPRPFHHVLLF